MGEVDVSEDNMNKNNMTVVKSTSLAPTHFRFLDLPGELRNAIYELSVVKHNVEIDVFSKLPPITQVCQEIRSESLEVFLGRNHFVVKQLPDIIDYLVHCLESMGAKPLRHLKRLSLEFALRHTHASSLTLVYSGDFRTWHELATCLTAFGLRPSQLHSTWERHTQRAQAPYGWIELALNVHFFVKYTLQPFLKVHHLFDKDIWTINVLSDLDEVVETPTPYGLADLFAGQAKFRIESFEFWAMLIRSSSPQTIYRKYMSAILREGPGIVGNFYGLKDLLARVGNRDFRGTDEFQSAVQCAVPIQRERHRRKRAEANESYISETKSGYGRSGWIRNQRRNSLHQQNNTSTSNTFVKAEAPKTNPMPALKLGFTSSMTEARPNQTNFGSADHTQPFWAVNQDSKSSFADLTASPTTTGIHLNADFTADRARPSALVSRRSVFEFVLNDAGKRVLRRKLPTK